MGRHPNRMNLDTTTQPRTERVTPHGAGSPSHTPSKLPVGDSATIQLIVCCLLVPPVWWTVLGGGVELLYLVVLTTSGILLAGSTMRRNADPLHPWAFPQLYVVYALAAPWFFLVLAKRDLFRIPVTAADGPAALIIALSAAGWLLGTVLGTNRRTLLDDVPEEKPQTEAVRGRWELRHFRAMRQVGIVLFLITLALKAVQVALGRGRAYGAGQTGSDLFVTLTPVVEGLFLASVLLVVATAAPIGKRPLPIWFFIGLAGYAGASFLFLGSRGEVIAPAMLIVWFLTRRRPVSIVKLLPLGIAAVLIFNWVGDTRTQGEAAPGAAEASAIERSLLDTSSPYLVTMMLAEMVPSSIPHSGGQTYVESAKYFLPGVVSRALFGRPQETASLIFRDIVGYDNPNSGLGFSLPSEAYLNYGKLGAFGIPLVLGWAFARSYRLTQRIPRRVAALIYPVALAILPYGLRADSLSQSKSLLYPLIFAALAAALAVRRASDEQEEQ